MKMKKYLYLLLYVWTGVLFASCENVLDYQQKEQPRQLVVNALLESDVAGNKVYLSLSGKTSAGYLERGSVSVYVNDEWKEKQEAVCEINQGGSDFLMYSQLETLFHPGDRIKIEAEGEADGVVYNAFAEVSVPYPIDPIQVDTMTTRLWNGFEDIPAIRYFITLKDRPNEQNYYRLKIYSGTYWNAEIPEGWSPYDLETIYDQEEIVLSEGHYSNENDDRYNNILRNIKNVYSVFMDNHFKNQSYTLRVYTRYRPAKEFAYEWQKHIQTQARICIQSLTEEEYRYLRALTLLSSDEYEEALMEPVIIPTNVTGGLGFVGASSVTYHQLRIMDKPPRK